jgi:anhydro-N-acetylmuramic acid kinase
MQDSLTILGLMSGTSLDGLDLALCRISGAGTKYKILRAQTIPYSAEWKQKLRNAEKTSGEELAAHDKEYGQLLGEMCVQFLGNDKPDYIASHGHTIFHDPANGYTFQSGSGSEIARITGITTVNDFRTTDVSLGGQGAPLVPIGDQMLFGNYTYCLNLGGFVNISFEENGARRAFDVVPLNYVLNRNTTTEVSSLRKENTVLRWVRSWMLFPTMPSRHQNRWAANGWKKMCFRYSTN